MARRPRRPGHLLVVAALSLGAAASSGCRSHPCDAWDRDGDGTIQLAVLGDSNSYSMARGIWSVQVRQALQEADPGRWSPRNYARLGARITENDRSANRSGSFQVGLALAAEPPIEVALLAFGTNDVVHGRTPEEIVEAYGAAKARLEAAGIRVLIATTPPCWKAACDRERIAATNALTARRWPDMPLVDFSMWVMREDMGPDGLHFSREGQMRRAQAALRVLRACPGG